jgi:hypothetical protein
MFIILSSFVIALGVPPLRSRSTRTAARAEALGHGAVALGMLAFLLLAVPRIESLFREYDMPSAWPSMLVFGISDVTVKYVYVAMPFVALLIALECRDFVFLHDMQDRRALARAWSAGITALFLGMTLFCVWAIVREFFATYVSLSRTEYLF